MSPGWLWAVRLPSDPAAGKGKVVLCAGGVSTDWKPHVALAGRWHRVHSALHTGLPEAEALLSRLETE